MLSTIQVSSVVTAMQSGFSLALLEALGVLTVQTTLDSFRWSCTGFLYKFLNLTVTEGTINGSYSMATLYMLANQAAFFPTGSVGEIIIHKCFHSLA